MIFKVNTLSQNQKGSKEYLLNYERVTAGTARIIEGNADITGELIKRIQRKHKYLSCGLMFHEDDKLTKEQIQEIITDFKKVMFAGLDSQQYNCLIVEHTDKNRLELNFLIPRVELNTLKDLSLYTHMKDKPLFTMWQNGINKKYGLADPNDPARKRSQEDIAKARLKNSRMKNTDIIANRGSLDQAIHKMYTDGLFESRDELVAIFVENGYTITRENEKSISVKHENIGKRALKLEGGIYGRLIRDSKKEPREERPKTARSDRSTFKKYLERRTSDNTARYGFKVSRDRKKVEPHKRPEPSHNNETKHTVTRAGNRVEDRVSRGSVTNAGEEEKDTNRENERAINDRARAKAIKRIRRAREELQTRARERNEELREDLSGLWGGARAISIFTAESDDASRELDEVTTKFDTVTRKDYQFIEEATKIRRQHEEDGDFLEQFIYTAGDKFEQFQRKINDGFTELFETIKEKFKREEKVEIIKEEVQDYSGPKMGI